MNGRDRKPQQGQGHRGPQQQNEPRKNEALAEFIQKTQSEDFTFIKDDVMALSNALGKSLTYNSQVRGEREGKENTKTQVRKFYNLVRVAQTTASGEGTQAEVVKVKLRTLQAQVAYAVARKTISPEFKEFFDASLKKIIESADLKNSLNEFSTFFESLYAYFYYHMEVR